MKNKKFIILITIVIVLALSVFGLYLHSQLTLPDIYPKSFENNSGREALKIDDIPTYLKNATVVIEDKGFYNNDNKCNNLLRILLCSNEKCKYQPSLLTQQVVKNLLLNENSGKKEQLLLACEIEKKLSKDEVLQTYLNDMQYSEKSYGVQAASKEIFGKDLKELDLSEYATLAALPQAPIYYSPFGEHKDVLIEKRNYIIDLMFNEGYIGKEELDYAKTAKLDI